MNIGGLSGTTSNTIRGFGGLASGLDRDSLIEGMTSGTTAKINKQQQKKTLLQWEQTAIRNITDKLTSFADKYTSTYASGTNLFSSSLWGRNKITALGANSKYVSVSGSANTADTLEIQRIKQLAKKAQLTSSDRVSDSTLQTGKIDLTEEQRSANLEGKTLTFEYSGKEYTVTLPTGNDKDGKEYKYDTVDNAIDSLKRAFKDVEVEGGKKLSEVINVEKDGNDKIKFTDKLNAGNTLKLTGGSATEYLGFTEKDTDGNFKEIDFTKKSATSNEAITDDKLFTKTPFIDRIAGKSLTFNYNGTSKTIKMPTKEELEDAKKNNKLSETLTKSMQTQLDEAFGKGRVTVEFKADTNNANVGQFTFKTTTPDGKEDNSSVLSLSSADVGMLGADGAFKVAYGESNRINLNSTLVESGLKGADKLAEWFKNNPDKKFSFTIKDGIKDVKIEISKDDTMQDVMNRINEETSVQVTYQSTTDKFVFTSKNEGASGSFKFEPDSGNEEILKGIFGDNITDEAKGTDAKLEVKYAGSDEVVEITRDSNTFKVDGMTITLNGTFGYDKDGNKIDDTEAITFDAKVDNEKIVETVKEMVKEFNEIIELVNKEVKTKPDRDYAPLTDEQKKELSESEIEAWEEKAKEGLLFNDNDIKGLSNGLRFVLGSGDLQALEKIGLTVSSTTSDNGKLSFDESKFKAALESDPEGVKELFTKEQVKDEAGNVVQSSGIATNLKNVLDKYAKTIGEPKGILINRAGSIKSPASITQNELYKQILEVDKRISSLQDTLKMEQDRYIRQFTTLESLIAQMNSQSSALSQFGGGF
ncbi:MAG: flagellar filament capping protein FliD [Lachnospiraceae bacterium]|nr:flagellar filament capping protein FliD [Lachnospiraceae bacterium]